MKLFFDFFFVYKPNGYTGKATKQRASLFCGTRISSERPNKIGRKLSSCRGSSTLRLSSSTVPRSVDATPTRPRRALASYWLSCLPRRREDGDRRCARAYSFQGILRTKLHRRCPVSSGNRNYVTKSTCLFLRSPGEPGKTLLSFS